VIARAGLFPATWRKAFPSDSHPLSDSTSTCRVIFRDTSSQGGWPLDSSGNPSVHSPGRRLGLFLAFGLLALLMIAVPSAVWGALVFANLKASPTVPWCLPAVLMVLWLFWQYAGGRGWPSSTAAERRALRRANPVSGEAFAWSLMGGGLAIGALAGLWIVLFQLTKLPPNVLLPANFISTPWMVGSIVLGASLVAPITEESAVRGYLQVVLEREFRPLTAVMLSSIVFALAHLSQGLPWAKLLIYFLVGLTFGAMAWLNNSILPVIPVHIAGDLSFFLWIWPNDVGRKLVWQSGADGWFWLHLAQVFVCTALSLLAFWRLHRAPSTRRLSSTG
jgi:membrane protease YdiL (CAAX protease family)